jgi:D-alanine-D-alanine ligase
MKIALLYNSRPDCAATSFPDDTFEEYDSDETIQSIANALRDLGVTVEPILADRRLPWRLEEGHYDFAFNIAEGEGRRCREAIPTAVCELLGVPFTGSDALTLAITLDKAIARRVVSPDVPIARGVLVTRSEEEAALEALRYPVLVKPNDEGSSKGIRETSVALDIVEAIAQCRWLREHYTCPVLVEEYLPGIEVTVGIVGNGPETRVLGMMEIAPMSEEQFFVYSLEVKRNWRQRVRYYVPPRLSAATLATLERNALTAYRLLGCRDCARLDFRLNAAGQPCFIECNPLPGLNPTHSDLVILSREVLSYEELVQGILLDAMQRVGVRVP